MKKNILFIAAALFLFFGNQSLTAQEKMKKETKSTAVIQKSEVTAKEKTMNLIRPLELSKKQQQLVYGIFQKTEEKMGRAGIEASAKDLEARQAKIDKYIMSEMKEILNEEQFKKYLNLIKN